MTSSIPTIPTDNEGDNRWMSQHTRFMSEIKEKEPDVIFIGDTFAQAFQFTPFWKRHMEPLHCLNFGICDDRTENIIWRVENGELDGRSLQAVVIMAGSCNIGDSADDVIAGISALVKKVADRQPKAHIIVMGLLPCGEFTNPRRTKHKEVNAKLPQLSSQFAPNITLGYVPVDWGQFIHSGPGMTDRILSHDMPDWFTPSAAGYEHIMPPLFNYLEDITGPSVSAVGGSL